MSGNRQGYSPQQAYPPQHGYAPPAYSEKSPSEPQMKTMIVREPQPQPSDYLSLAIFVTILCCLPLGIVGLIKAGEIPIICLLCVGWMVKSKYSSGDYNGALESSRGAKNWSIAGLIAGIIMWVLAVVFLVVYVMLIMDQSEGDDADGGKDPYENDDTGGKSYSSYY